MKHRIFFLVFGGFILLVWCLGIFFYRSPFPVAIDVFFHFRFAEDFAQAVSEGDYVPDWDARPYGGRGTAGFRFYAPLIYYLCFPLIKAGMPIYWAFKLIIFLFIGIGAWGSWRWFQTLHPLLPPEFGPILLLGGPIIPMHLFYIFNVQNFCAILLLPWILMTWTRSQTSFTGTIHCSLILGFMGLTHLPATLMTGYILLCLAILRGCQTRAFRSILRLIFICVIAAGIFAPYAVPALMATSECHFEVLKDFVPWNRTDFFDDPMANENPVWEAIQKVFGLIFFITFLFGCAGVIFSWKKLPNLHRLLFPFFTATLLGLLTFRFSIPVWKILPGIKVLQFPYRWVFPIYILLMPIMAAMFSSGEHRSRGKTIFGGFFLTVLFLLSFGIQYTGKDLPPESIKDFRAIRIRYPQEYIPLECQLYKTIPCEAGKVREIKGLRGIACFSAEEHRFSSSSFKCFVQSASATIEIVTHADSSWVLLIDGTPHPIIVQDPCGLIHFSVEKGEHNVFLCRNSPKGRNLGIMTFLGTLLFLFGSLKNRNFFNRFCDVCANRENPRKTELELPRHSHSI